MNEFEFDNNHKFIDFALSPAEIQSVCFQHDNVNECLKELEVETTKHLDRIKKYPIKK